MYDSEGRKITVFTDRRDPEQQGSAHQANFIEAMRSRKPADLNAEVVDGHYSASLCHMANVSYRLGIESSSNDTIDAAADNPQWSDACERFGDHLLANGIDLEKTPAILGPWVTMDPDSETFIGPFAEQANSLSRRHYREPFVVPDIV